MTKHGPSPYPDVTVTKGLMNLSADDATRLCRFIILTASDARGCFLDHATQAEIAGHLHQLALQSLPEKAA